MQITAAESHIMEALWRRGSLTVDEIVAEVAAQEWALATVKTLINRLLKKGHIRSARNAGRYEYSAVVARSDYTLAESQGLLDRLFGGRIAPLVAHFAEHRKLDADDIARLKALIKALENE
ncbi:BlaI/MecI/CopY family transcriptional regulator [Bradyrhizobium sp. WD16]|nr:BlaI/MecI/CopY family transcriptional regulator [Bradyrhizobium sp. WD16]UTD29570.1 BlaI/MecI/CopY family transcriptional regulator [Bradyrhizobium sp. WD16]